MVEGHPISAPTCRVQAGVSCPDEAPGALEQYKSHAIQSVSIIAPFQYAWSSFLAKHTVSVSFYPAKWRSKPSDILGWFATMRWLMIGLLVSLGAMLFAVGAAARHIWLHRKKLRHEPHAPFDAHETDLES
jgi:hypothetical protein